MLYNECFSPLSLLLEALHRVVELKYYVLDNVFEKVSIASSDDFTGRFSEVRIEHELQKFDVEVIEVVYDTLKMLKNMLDIENVEEQSEEVKLGQAPLTVNVDKDSCEVRVECGSDWVTAYAPIPTVKTVIKLLNVVV